MGYLAIIAARFRTLLQYRAAALAGLFTQIFFGIVRIMILSAFYAASRSQHAPMSMREVVGYVWLGQAMLLLMPWRIDEDVLRQVNDGSIVYELARPLDLQAVWLARGVAWRTAPVLLRLVPMLVLAMVVLPIFEPAWALAPPSAAAFVAWLACFTGAVVLSASISALMNVTLLWSLAGSGIPMIVGALATIFGGLTIPLVLFPEWSQPIIYALPFAGLLDLPSRIFTGNLPASDVIYVLADQLAWSLVLIAFGRWLLARGVRKLVVQGG
jgi:ABC-2 type transport system permease protein